ncbi:Nuclear hormone receptor family member nhr-77 [Caenorhabditis elegans]|uniref:Nuclear hormone receptor family member nhr-77 n=1 Tax=Caenorhabditis elegans TaxID=6239 RepID=NHR77_CAEEL|nr:Nuclear hormone receptor family member nhr-77 [Caenorhabditis elegans]O02316.2 RecName: Full=Nuclear hormone receptor family member nhr-77 [Caenorhabditis elegans]CAB05622.2 Nuclear hormone receptor family member nhr-77 [Caenorhabditis elegans]|eukprot:NP_493137.2 Nuclear hormone receptor family member nhr-77 [Caenorhabditis elegans]
MPIVELADPICPVCEFPSNVELHFGGLVCGACAAFFRRTVSLNIRYLCEKNNQCKGMRKNCRACRFDYCVKIAGMKRNLVKQRRNSTNTPMYILNRRKDSGNEEVVRGMLKRMYLQFSSFSGFVTTTQSKWAHHSRKSSMSPNKEAEKDVSKILKISHGSLLKYYIYQITHDKRNNMNTLNIKSVEEFLEITSVQNKLAAELCKTCPGVDLLDNEDILILRKYFQFSNVWIESTWNYLRENNSVPIDDSELDLKLLKFINQVKSTLLVSFSQLKFNTIEFAAFKSICIWKLVYHETSRAMKIIAQEHYESVMKALNDYYQTYTSMDSMQIATRIGEITLLIISVFQMYHDMAKLYIQLGLPF